MAGVEIIVIYAMHLGGHIPGLGIQDKWNAAEMMRGVAHEDAYPRSLRSLIVGLLSLKLIFQDVNWRTKCVEVINIGLHFRSIQSRGWITIVFIR